MNQPSDELTPQDKQDFLDAWVWLLGVVALGAVAFLAFDPRAGEVGQHPFFTVAALAEAIAIICWFIHSFTGMPYRKRTQAIILAYFVVCASMLILAVPAFVNGQSIGGEPVGIVSGCVLRTEAKELLCYADQAAEDNAKKDAEDRAKKAAEEKAKKDAEEKAKKDAADKTKKAAEDKAKGKDKAKTEDKKKSADTTKGDEKSKKDDKAKDKSGNASGTQLRNQWLVSIGGTLTPQDPDPRKADCKLSEPCERVFVTGGAVVPLYFVILALIGGAISLSRRIPEIQKRSENGYVGTATDPKLQPGEVRELLAFQILQFVSAPLIAVAAFLVIKPDGMGGTAAVAFMSGFGSETVLLMIRGVFNGLRPQSVTVASTGTVTGLVTDAGEPVANIQVEIAGTGLKVKTENDGRYRIPEVPVGDRRMQASDRNRAGSAPVTVQAGQTASCDIALQRTGSVSGVVTDAKEAVGGALVTVAAAPTLLKAMTKPDGTYRIDRVPVGEQTLKAEHAERKLSGSAKAKVEYDKVTENCNITVSEAAGGTTGGAPTGGAPTGGAPTGGAPVVRTPVGGTG